MTNHLSGLKFYSFIIYLFSFSFSLAEICSQSYLMGSKMSTFTLKLLCVISLPKQIFLSLGFEASQRLTAWSRLINVSLSPWIIRKGFFMSSIFVRLSNQFFTKNPKNLVLLETISFIEEKGEINIVILKQYKVLRLMHKEQPKDLPIKMILSQLILFVLQM